MFVAMEDDDRESAACRESEHRPGGVEEERPERQRDRGDDGGHEA